MASNHTRSSRTENALRIITNNLLRQALDLIAPFLLRSVMIHTLGTLYLGVNGLFTSILQVLSLAELGFGEAVVFSMYKPFAEDDQNKICALMNLYRRVYRIIGATVFVIGIALLPFVRLLIHDELPPDVNIHIVYLLTLIPTCLGYVLVPHRSGLYYADQHSDVLSRIAMVVQIFDLSGKILVLFLLRNCYLFCAIGITSCLLTAGITFYASRRDYPGYGCRGEIPKEEKHAIRQKIEGLFVNKVCYVFRNAFDSITVSAFLGLASVSVFQNYFVIISGITKVSSIFTGSIQAGVGNSIASESLEKNHRDFRKFQLIFMWFTGWCTVCLFCLYQPVMRLWMGEARMLPVRSMIVYCVYYFVDMAGVLCFIYRQAAGLYQYRKFVPVIEAVVNVSLNVLLIRRFGMVGVLLSTIFCQVFINTLWSSGILYDYYFTEYKRRDYLLRLCAFAAVAFVACAITRLACMPIPLTGIPELLAKGCVCVVVPNIVFLCFMRMFPEFADAKEFLFTKILAKLHR